MKQLTSPRGKYGVLPLIQSTTRYSQSNEKSHILLLNLLHISSPTCPKDLVEDSLKLRIPSQ